MILFTYVVLFFLVIRFSVTLFNFLSNPKLPYFRQRLNGLVSVVITVKNEESNLLSLLAALDEQDYPDLEIIISHAGLDTADPALSGHRLKFIGKGSSKTSYDWLAPHINGDYILLLDSNIRVEKGFIYSLIYRSEVFKQPILAIIPNQKPRGLFQQLILPLQDFVLLNLIPLRVLKLLKGVTLINLRQDCIFFTLNAFKNYASSAAPVEILLANKMAVNRYDTDNTRLLKTSTEIFMHNMAGNLLSGFFYTFLVVAGPVILAFGVDPYILMLPAGL
ncbi:MAG: glycosyltransferase, partial [Pedobacter sp.]